MRVLMITPAFLLALFAGNGFPQGDPEILWSVEGHATSVEAVAWSPDGRTVASGSDYTESLVKVWRAGNGGLLHTLPGHDTGVRSLDFSPDGRYLAAGHLVSGYPPGGQTKLWDLQEQVVRFTFGGCFAAFSPDGELVASGGGGVNRYIQVYRVSDGVKVAQMYNGSYITSVAFSPDGETVATGGTDNTVKLWSAQEGTLVQTLTGHMDDVQAVAFSPDGQIVASGAGGWDSPGESSIKLWQVSDGSLIDTFAGHGDWVQKVAFSPDGKVLVSSGRDGVYPNVSSRIKFWSVPDGALLGYHEELAFDLAFSPDGRQFGYGSGGGLLAVADHPADGLETHLFYEGEAKAGNTVEVQLIGPPGSAPVGLWIGSGVLDPPLPSAWGDWHLQFPVFGPVVFGPIPAGGRQVLPVTVPAPSPGPYDLPLQALIGDELTNLCLFAVE